MDETTMRRLVADARVARLATADPDGRPHVVPIVFVLDGDTVYSAVDAKPKRSPHLRRVANVRDRPEAVSLLVDQYDEDWARLWWVRLRGRGRIVEEGQEQDRAHDLLRRKYDQYADMSPLGDVVAVEVTEWSGWSGGPIQ